MTEPAKKRAAVQAPPLLPHPLFEPEEPGDEAPIVYRIKVTRWGARGQRWVPQQFDASALISLEQIQRDYGGGDYELIAYGPGGCVARRRYSLDGRPRPLYADDDDDGEGGGFPGAAVAQPAPPAPSGSGGSSDWIPLLIAMMKTSADSSAAMFQGMMQMVGGMLSSSRDAASAQIASMQQLSTAHATEQARLLTAIVESKNGSTGGAGALVEMLKEGIELGRTRSGEGGDGDGDSGGIEGLISAAAPFIMGAMGAAAQQKPGAAPPASAVPPPLEPDPEAP